MQHHLARTTRFVWHGAGLPITLEWTEQGEGPLVLLLPALSTVSTRHEFAELQARLSGHYRTVSIDWPGFGDLPKPFIDGNAALLVRYLKEVLAQFKETPAMIVAAGHGAGLALLGLKDMPAVCERLVLIAPTWRGPLPTMAKGAVKPWFKTVRRVFDAPVIGPLLYWLNVRRWCIRKMINEHVYESPTFLTPARMEGKRQVPKSAGARHGSIRFVTGAFDAFLTNDAAFEAAERLTCPTLMLTTEHMPTRSKENMQRLTPLVESVTLSRGRLLVHEECPEAVYQAIDAFIKAHPLPS
ncbi:alpha/beta fold hydrolase [Larsenimonas suaedae]|uniref:Alpha/beta hydrolase n=1 Tax=Larsenimonas suaedae TaxID=1851019 RepID=A0ABU1GTD9_9GAMM|nr:alpha/beta hydrolase [Larsenimonas suaedae]MCM2971749.1 alpha/beta hydrolase [Larsenimonas suaedae]MDR5895301.1 alpha/beta hydrolase [Larsenimonas suaedae]